VSGDIATSTGIKTGTKEEVISPEGKKAVKGAFVGFFVDMFDIYLPTVALAPAMIYFLPKNLPGTIVNTLYYVTLLVTLLGRPVGSVVFGHFGDKIGRRKSSLISIMGFGTVTLLMALLPGYQTMGLGAIVLLLLLRFVDGVFLGGQYSTAIPLAMEYSPKHKRGWYSGFIQSGFNIAYIIVSIITAVLLKYMPCSDMSSPYCVYGWRIPFIVGAIISIAYYFYYKNVEESKKWEKTEKVKVPMVEIFSNRQSRRDFLQVFTLTTGQSFICNAIMFSVPGILINILKMNAAVVTNVMCGVYFVTFFMYLLGGIVSQAIGRRRLFVIAGMLNLTLFPYIYYLAVKYGPQMSFIALTSALALIISMSMGGTFAHSTAYLNERFRTAVRSSGYGMAYSFGFIIPAFYSFYMLGLKSIVPYEYTAIILEMLGGALVVIGALLGPETKDVDFV